MAEKLEKKDLIINEQIKEIELAKKEMRELRMEVRKKDEDLTKAHRVVMDKENHIIRLNEKIANLGTRDLMSLHKNIKKKVSQGVQTDVCTEKKNESDLRILDKLPTFAEAKESFTKRKPQFLNVNVSRGVHDRCFKCFDLEKKIRKLDKECNQQKEQIKEYQDNLGKIQECERCKNGLKGEREDAKGDGTVLGEGNEESKYESTNDQKDEEGKERVHEMNGDGKEGSTSMYSDISDDADSILDESFTIQAMNEMFLQNKTDNSKQREQKCHQDDSPLCNRFLWSGWCKFGEQCRYTHKKLCTNLQETGQCRRRLCEDGHNIDGICRQYNNGNCTNDERNCRFLHIKIKRREEGRVEPAIEEAHEEIHSSTTIEEEESQDEEYSIHTDDEEQEQDQEVDEWYCSSFEETVRETQVSGKEDGGNITDNARNEEGENKTEGREITVDRGLDHFLWLDRKHDIWSQIKATQAEIKELEKSIQGKKRKRHGGRHQ